MQHTTEERRRRWRFFLENAGYATPPGRAACALELARVEELLTEALELGAAAVEVVDDLTPWDEGTEISAEEATRRFQSGAWTGPYGVVVKVGADATDPHPCADLEYGSLWGVVVGPRGADDPYIRTVAAELALELVDELRQAVGDAKDARMLEGVV